LKKIFVLLLLLCNSQLHTQTSPDYQLLTTADGLSQGMVFDILQTKDGFIWIATKDGLNRSTVRGLCSSLPIPSIHTPLQTAKYGQFSRTAGAGFG
jgi:ligand-binding sensor domain-containing protein